MSIPVGARQTRRFERKREAILSAAAYLFNHKGFRGATLNDVAQSVDLITTSVTYYYKRKEDLAGACYALTIETINNVVAEAESAPDPETRIRRFFKLYFEMLAEIARGDRGELVNFYELRGFSGPNAPEIFNAYVNLFRRVRRLIRSDGAARLSQLNNNARAHLVFSVLLWARTWMRHYEADDYARAGERMCDILLNGIAGPRAAWAPLAPPEIATGEPSSEPGPDTFLHAATQMMNEHGYHGASVERIAAQLNVTKGSFYHHIDAKDDLIVKCFQRSFDIMRAAQRSAMASGADAWTQLISTAADLTRTQLSEQGPLLRYMALAAAPETMRGDLVDGMQRLTDRFAGIISDGVADGSIRPVDASIAAQLVFGMVNAGADLTQWVPGVTIDTAAALYARPLFVGVLTP